MLKLASNQTGMVNHTVIVKSLTALLRGLVGSFASGAEGHWGTTGVPAPLANRAVCQFIRVGLGGAQLRVHFANNYGPTP